MQSGCHRLKAMDLRQYSRQFLCRFLGIVVRLQAQPETAGCAEKCSQAQCGVRRDGTFSGAYCLDTRFGYADLLRQPVLRDAERNQKFFAQHFSGMDVGQLI